MAHGMRRPQMAQVSAVTDGEQVHLPRGLAGSFETAQIHHVHE